MPFKVMDHWYTPEEVNANPDDYYIFGDNTKRVGTGGQAKIRGCKNAIGIATKVAPGTGPEDYFDQSKYAIGQMLGTIVEDFKPVILLLEEKKTVWWPKDGIGTGLAELSTRAPDVLRFINICRDVLLRRYP